MPKTRAQLGLAIVVAGCLSAFVGVASAFHNPVSICDTLDPPFGEFEVRLAGASVGDLVPGSVICTWQHGEVWFDERRPVNQAGQLIGAVLVGTGASLLSLSRSGSGRSARRS